ncbi:MAG: 16S rRNA (adenine(1518)-N(6)/adenine(1519)-N(6))-dimethyltransferase RsmA [Candidatus Goldbacteria bacterium]|nr:16S rRNA (adenine(1518)-N(6)/adenine(1519)-N(6))-dimethyltransferase RsmA [Candidatus Goldiibacteriota bacterium]
MDKFKYKKHLGQHFLHNTAKLNQISNFICKEKDCLIIEIGPGKGALTEYLVKKAKMVVAIEIDKDAVNKLQERFPDANNLKIINCDFLKFNLKNYLKDLNRKVIIAGNIPYYITAPIIEKIIEVREFLDKAYLTVQKEVAERIVAKEGSKIYSSLSVYCQFYADVKILLNIDRESFFPVPDVDSCFVEFDFNKKNKIYVIDEEIFFKIVHCGFAHRRKMFINNFKKTFDLSQKEAFDLLKKVKIEEHARAEDISILKFAELSNVLYNLKKKLLFNEN